MDTLEGLESFLEEAAGSGGLASTLEFSRTANSTGRPQYLAELAKESYQFDLLAVPPSSP
jgi:hypothetical protein